MAHGIPGDRVLKEGDLVNVDVSGSLDGYYADTGISFVVGKGDPELFALCECAQLAFDSGLKKSGPAIGRIKSAGRLKKQCTTMVLKYS